MNLVTIEEGRFAPTDGHSENETRENKVSIRRLVAKLIADRTPRKTTTYAANNEQERKCPIDQT